MAILAQAAAKWEESGKVDMTDLAGGSKIMEKSLAKMQNFSEEKGLTSAPEKATGQKCYNHKKIDAKIKCQMCLKPICPDCIQTPLIGQKLYGSTKELAKVPHQVCPNCVKPLLKKWGPKSKSQIKGYMDSH